MVVARGSQQRDDAGASGTAGAPGGPEAANAPLKRRRSGSGGSVRRTTDGADATTLRSLSRYRRKPCSLRCSRHSAAALACW